MIAHAEKLLTPQEYLDRERHAQYKSEYIDGQVFGMAGASRQHNLIVANIIRTLGNQLVHSPCNVYPGDMRVKIPKINKYTYPDVVLACSDELFEDNYSDTLLNPLIVIEVLSESTESYDRGKKFAHYQTIDSLSEYILVDQSVWRVEQYVRQTEKQWTYDVFYRPDDVLQLKPVECTLALEDLYLKLVNV